MFFIIDLPDQSDGQAPLAYQSEPIQSVNATSELATRLAAEAQVPQLQLGDFTLGDTDCPSLTGHPDIRY